ncbi:MAG: xanthine dehydrogenase family protein molybdopterin-binding subunit, partial [Novosphingobium sp.]|nr:xanthine dehydrogenase family protein molybdopterin-binding subunit [Novosphingobium sp.]
TSATARFANGKLELWMGCQAPQSAREVAAHALGIDVRDVVLYAMPAGGSFDRRLEVSHAAQAALIARHAAKPVQLTWSRWQEHLAGWPRTPIAALMGARTDVEGRLAGWRTRIAVPATVREFGERLFARSTPHDAIDSVAGDADPLAVEGAVPPYALANLAIEQVPVTIDLPTARLRGNAHGYTAFFNETFIDELAHQANREPLAYRMALLGKEPRLAECLQRVAALSDWGGGGDSSGQGLACHIIGTGDGAGRIAVVATAQRADSGVRVDRISAVVDIGRIVNEDIARQQIEGGLVFGLGLAIGSATGYERGLPTARRLSHLNLPLLADCPEIEVQFIASDAPSADPGELGVVAAPPAIGNALFSATGLRFRRLPLLSDGL